MSIRNFVLVLTAVVACGCGGNEERPPNVLFIAVDDLRPEVSVYGDTVAKTPQMDRLAARGLRFARAYCQQAICGPSRASLMTGLRPDSAGVVDNATYFRDTVPAVVTLPEHFRSHGYTTAYIGKIYHGRFRDEERSWSRKAVFPEPGYPRDVGGYQLAENQELVKRRRAEVKQQYGAAAPGGLANGPATEAAEVPDNAYADGRTADAAVATLGELAGEPFFLGVGFLKPHLPFVAPKKYWDLYDPSEIPLAENTEPPQGAPAVSLHSSFELRTRAGIPKAGPIDDQLARRLIHGYLACASYVDAQVGKVLAELDRLGLRENTIIVLWGDHGWHLGDFGIWGKATNYEIATRVPLIVSAPGRKVQGAATESLVGLLDLYPTLCDLAGLPLPSHLEGRSFAKLLDRPDAPGKAAVYSQFPSPALREWAALPLSEGMRQTFFGPLIRNVEDRIRAENPARWNREFYERYVMGYAMRTERYRLVRWVDIRDRTGEPLAVELYDHAKDPDETANVAAENPAVVADLTARMTKALGWAKRE